jgi:hypothetical protein
LKIRWLLWLYGYEPLYGFSHFSIAKLAQDVLAL